jgi:hypothetical protein
LRVIVENARDNLPVVIWRKGKVQKISARWVLRELKQQKLVTEEMIKEVKQRRFYRYP